MVKKLKILTAGLMLIGNDASYGRWAIKADAGAIMKSMSCQFNIQGTATYTKTCQEQLYIQNLGGVDQFRERHFTYNPSAESIKILEVKVQNQNSIKTVDISDATKTQRKSSPIKGYDSQATLTLSIPKVKVGSLIFLKYEKKVRHSPVVGAFSELLHFGETAFTESVEYSFSSQIPLQTLSNDPSNHLVIQEQKDNKPFEVNIKLRMPIYKVPIHESEYFTKNNRDEFHLSPQEGFRTWALITSEKSYENIGTALGKAFAESYQSGVPKQLRNIAKRAARQNNVFAQILYVTSELNRKYKTLPYFGTVKGRVVPRDLDEIADSKTIDSKELSLLTSILLRSLQLESHIAYIQGGYRPVPLKSLPHVSDFDRAVLLVKGEGQVYWVDPDDFDGLATTIPAQMANRTALMLYDNPSLLAIPPNAPENSEAYSTVAIYPSEGSYFYVDTAKTLSGVLAAAKAYQLYPKGEKAIKKDFLVDIPGSERAAHINPILPDIQEKKVTAMNFKARIVTQKLFSQTSLGEVFTLGRGGLEGLYHLDVNHSVADVFLGLPSVRREVVNFRNLASLRSAVPECEVQSVWMDIKREVTAIQNSLTVQTLYRIKQPLVTNHEIKSEPFRQFHNIVKQCFAYDAIVTSAAPPVTRANAYESSFKLPAVNILDSFRP